MELTKTFDVSKQAAEFVALALSRDPHRQLLNHAAISVFGFGKKKDVWLAATDTHRLHMVRIASLEEATLIGTKILDLKRVLYEAKFVKADTVTFSTDFSEVGLKRTSKRDTDEEFKIHTPVLDQVLGTYPNFERVIPTKINPIAHVFAINYRYFADACSLTRDHASRTILFQEGNLRPILALPSEGVIDSNGNYRDFDKLDPEWLSVIMPMSRK